MVILDQKEILEQTAQEDHKVEQDLLELQEMMEIEVIKVLQDLEDLLEPLVK